MAAAFAEQERSDRLEAHRAWIRLLLSEYYDPMYNYQMSQRDGTRLFRGSRDAVIAAAEARCSDG